MTCFRALTRRRTALLALATALLSAGASAQDYSAKPIRMVVPFAPGGTTDVLARIVAEKLQQVLKQPSSSIPSPGPTACSVATSWRRPRPTATPSC